MGGGKLIRLIIILVASVVDATGDTAAESIKASVKARIYTPTEVSVDAAAALLSSNITGVLMLSIPGIGGSAGSAPSTMMLTASGEVASGSPTVFSANDSGGLAARISEVIISGGTLSTSGTVSGTGVQIVVLQAPSGGERGTVTATVTYN